MRTSSYRHMRDEERETLRLGLAHGHSLRARASGVGRVPLTVSRESARHAVRGPYRACPAHPLASARARQPRRSRTLLDPWLWQYVRTQLAEGGSPEQIAGRLPRASPGDMRNPRSAEPLYAGWSVLPRGTLRSERLAALRQARKARRPRSRGTDRRGQIPTMTPIAKRPAEVALRTVPGPWEGDVITGARHGSAVGTLVERTTRPVILAKMKGTDATSVRAGLTKNSALCPPCCVKP